jgi:hypothetical protein
LTAKGNQEGVTLGIEGSSDKLLTLVLATLALIIGQHCSLFVAHGFADSEDSFLANSIALAHAEEISLGGHGDVGDGFGALGACLYRYEKELGGTYLARSTGEPSPLVFCTVPHCGQLGKRWFDHPRGRSSS